MSCPRLAESFKQPFDPERLVDDGNFLEQTSEEQFLLARDVELDLMNTSFNAFHHAVEEYNINGSFSTRVEEMPTSQFAATDYYVEIEGERK